MLRIANIARDFCIEFRQIEIAQQRWPDWAITMTGSTSTGASVRSLCYGESTSGSECGTDYGNVTVRIIVTSFSESQE